MAIRELDDALRRKTLIRVLENLRRSIYCLAASNGLSRAAPKFSGPQIFPLARDALFFHSILHAAKVFDHHPRSASFFKLQAERPDLVSSIAQREGFDLARLGTFSAKLRQIRNRALAHDDIDDLERGLDIWVETDLTVGELLACTRFAFAAMNEMLNAEFGESVELLPYDGGDAEEIARLASANGLPDKWARRLF